MRIIVVIAVMLYLTGCADRYAAKYWCMGLGGTWTEEDGKRPYCDLEGTLAR